MTAFPQPASGCFDGAIHRYALRVFYEATDAGGVVYHANYLRWLERARSDMLRLLGIDQRAALDEGKGAYTVSELAIRYLVPARLDDLVEVESRVEDLRAASCRMVQRVFRGDAALTEARLRIGFVDPAGRPKRQPDAWRKAFATLITDPEGQQ